MKKVLMVGTLEEFKKSGAKNSQIVAGSGTQSWIKNLDLRPAHLFEVSFNQDSSELTIKAKIPLGKYLAIQDE